MGTCFCFCLLIMFLLVCLVWCLFTLTFWVCDFILGLLWFLFGGWGVWLTLFDLCWLMWFGFEFVFVELICGFYWCFVCLIAFWWWVYCVGFWYGCFVYLMVCCWVGWLLVFWFWVCLFCWWCGVCCCLVFCLWFELLLLGGL